jgi:transposase InsO family protein
MENNMTTESSTPSLAEIEPANKWKQILKKIYSTPGHAAAYSSARTLQTELKKTYKQFVPINEIQDWLTENYSYTIHKYARSTFKHNPIIATHIDQQWQGDLLFLPELAYFNKGFKIALVCIDVLTRFAWGELMKKKDGEATTKAFRAILKRSSPRKPDKLQTDKGKEFLNRQFQNLCKENDIIFFTTNSDFKAAIAERFIRTIKTKIYQYLDDSATNTYIDQFQALIDSYNSTIHSTIGIAPKDVNESNVPKVLNHLYGDRWFGGDKLREMKFKVGDFVRISGVHGNIFRKGYKKNWMKEMFKIASARHFHPQNEYRIVDLMDEPIKGTYYEQELQKIPSFNPETHEFRMEKIVRTRTLKGKPKEHLIKWEGYPEKFNSWVKASSVKKIRTSQ